MEDDTVQSSKLGVMESRQHLAATVNTTAAAPLGGFFSSDVLLLLFYLNAVSQHTVHH